MRILVIDDSMIARESIRKILNSSGFHKVSFCDSGESGLKFLKKRKQVQDLDIVLIDWHMKGMSGLECLKKIRENEETYFLPVIMVTTETLKKNIIKAIEQGANDYIIKPVQSEILIQKIEKIINEFNLENQSCEANTETDQEELQSPIHEKNETHSSESDHIKNIDVLSDSEFNDEIDKILNKD